MEIVTKIKPLYDDLIDIGFIDFLKTNEFIRLCNELKITDQYTLAYNEVAENSKNDWAWLGIDEMNYERVLSKLLGILFSNKFVVFPDLIINVVIAYLPHSNYVASIDNFRRDIQLLGASDFTLSLLDEAWNTENRNYHKKIVVLRNLLLDRATGGVGNEDYYLAIRHDLMKQVIFKTLVPDFVQNSRNLYEFWQYIKNAFKSYAERRFFLQEAFEPVLSAALVLNDSVPHHDIIPQIISIDEQYIAQAWRKALDRMNDDPEAAITTSRTLIEMVCKHILDESGTIYNDAAELPKLYKQTAAILNLSPDQHSEQLFKQILGGCQSVVEGLGGLRNKFGDAHGMSKNRPKPGMRHAALAVNLSGSMCSFLLQTFNHVKVKN